MSKVQSPPPTLSETAPAQTDAAALTALPEEQRALHKRILPWLSLIVGIAGAFTLDRGPRRAALVASAAVLSWSTLVLLHWLSRRGHEASSPWRQRAMIAVRHSSLMATQSALQLGFFFALPFYWQAATFEPGHALFLVALALLSAGSLWDPFTEWLLLRPLLGPLLPSTSSFVALNAVLPGLGLSTHASLWCASLTAALGVMVHAASNVPRTERKRVALWTLLPSLVLPLALPLGLTRIIPAAPLRLAKIEIGTHSEGKWIADPQTRLDSAPPQLFCATAIGSPVGVKDRLFHVWTHDGIVRSRIELDIRGGRRDGYRTRSRLALGPGNTEGNYTCQVQTASGQVLGRQTLSIVSR
jgi:hypothetical protein